jgi:hypothetical protein
MPEVIMQQQRGSPAANMNFPDPSLAPPGALPFYQQMPQNAMMRPPSSHPGPGFNGQQPTPQQIEAMRNGQMNGQMNGGWRGPPQPGMMPQPGMGGPMGGGPPRSQMPPPPAPSNEQPRPEPSPSVSNQAPPTPNQGNKAAPKKKQSKDNKPATKKGPNAGTGNTPVTGAGDEAPTPTPSTPITSIHKPPFPQGPNGQQQPAQPPSQQPTQQQPMGNDPPFGDLSSDPGNFDLGIPFDGDAALEGFDFDSFLHTGDDNNGFGSLVGFDDFNNGVETDV